MAFAEDWAKTRSVQNALATLAKTGGLGNQRAEQKAFNTAGYAEASGYGKRIADLTASVMAYPNAQQVAHEARVAQRGFDDRLGQVKPGGYLPDLTPSLATPQQQAAGVWSDRFDAPQAPAPYSPSNLDFGPDFTSPPSQARGAATDPYGFSNVNTALEAAPGSFAGYGPNAFAGLDEAAVDYGQTYPEISAGLYDQPAAPMSNEDFNAIFGNMPDDSTGATGASGSVRGSRASAAPQSFSPAVNAAQVGGPYSFSDLQSGAPAPDAATIAGDVTGYGPGGAFGSRAPSPGFDFASTVNAAFGPYTGADVPAVEARPTTVGPGPATAERPAEESAAFNSRMSDLLSPGLTGGLSAFQDTPLGIGQGIIDQGPYSSPIGYADRNNSFSPANLAVSTQAPQIVGYEPGKTISKEVTNPAWSDWSKDYATRNASQEAWLNADEDKRAWDRAPPNPSVLADTKWAGFKEEPAKTITVTRETPPTPIYSSPVASVPAVTAQPALGSAIQAQPSTWTPGMTQQAQNFSSLLGSIGGYGLQGVEGTFGTGFDLAGLGYGGSTGAWGGGYSDSGYGGYGGYGGISPGDAGYGSDARSGSGNMGAGNLYQ
jgi:hypothetical protein